MAWTEETDGRTLHSRRWYDPATKQLRVYASVAPLCYPSGAPDDPANTPLDLAAVRINNAQLDGWRVTANNWHFAIGQPGNKPTDGWIGFGGRKGSHWFTFRLMRFGYLHMPTRAWDDVGGAPTYNRANLSRSTQNKTLGPIGAQVSAPVQSIATWTGLWTTPGGGSVDIRWRLDGRRLKEEIVINEAARNWVAANRPPSTPVLETWFGAVFQVDVEDIPRWKRNGVLQTIDTNTDFDDGDGTVKWAIEDATSKLLAFLPINKAYSDPYTVGEGPKRKDAVTMRRRFWRDGDGNYYLAAGVRVDQLNDLHAGAITLDPTFTISEDSEDSGCVGAAETPSLETGTYLAAYEGAGFEREFGGIWRSTGIPRNAIILSAVVVLQDAGDTSVASDINGNWFGYAVDSPNDFDVGHTHRVSDHHTRTSASADGTIPASHTGQLTSNDLSSVVQEIVDRPGYDGDIGITWRIADPLDFEWYNWTDYATSPANAADLVVTYTDPPGGGAFGGVFPIHRWYRPRPFAPGFPR